MHSWLRTLRRIALFVAGSGSMLGAFMIQFTWFDATRLATAPAAQLAGLLGLLLLPIVVLGAITLDRSSRRSPVRH